ncbi:hypothetical protein QFC22_006082 [Naganishia vaughanmartiniae]|uniref:Uncharacterized protein n=1 Tax=Naganishia vaughanmartiniae TaxID=1424756 RepID=A0ACC2WNB7_9TREE|nr:hypothetical protein QFC22_006082 [Naganishia vaughanmartiniae]
MSAPFRNSAIPITPFKISHTQQEINDLRTLLRLSPLGPTTYENSPSRPTNFGISMSQMTALRSEWLEYDWFATQDSLNAKYPQFIAQVDDVCPKSHSKHTLDIHFIGYESGDPSAIPVLLLHGWPGMGCFELAPMIEHLQKFSNQPLNIIVPSLPGFLYSSPPPTDIDFDFDAVARVMHNFMLGLGYKSGYATQVNFMMLKLDTPALVSTPLQNETDKSFVERYIKFQKTGMGYALEHGTRPSTIGFTVTASPLSLAAWIGEKIVDSFSPPIPTATLLQWLTLFHLTTSFPTSIYLYRHLPSMGDYTALPTPSEAADLSKPLKGLRVGNGKKIGYSTFPREIFPVPKLWAEMTGDLVFYRLNEKGQSYESPLQLPSLPFFCAPTGC